MKSAFQTKEQYLNFKSAWKQAHDTKELKAIHFAMYCLIMGQDPKKTFTPLQDVNKISNSGSGYPFYSAILAFRSLNDIIRGLGNPNSLGYHYKRQIVPFFGPDVLPPETLMELFGRCNAIIKELEEFSV